MKKLILPLVVALGLVSGSGCIKANKPAAPRAALRCQESSAKLALTVDRETLDLEEGRARVRVAGPACTIALRITRKGGLPPVDATYAYSGPELELRWKPVPRGQIDRIEIWAASEEQVAKGVRIEPWSVTIESRNMEFAANEAVIRESSADGLHDTAGKIRLVLDRLKGQGIQIKLFVVGYPDAQNRSEADLALLHDRAQAIADWLVQQRVCVPLAYVIIDKPEGSAIGASGVPWSQRVQYTLAVEAPKLEGGVAVDWQWLPNGCRGCCRPN